ncbi:uncharacterized protein [Littorina saxatilis]|uniref:Protein kinase domain-containing protein n=1 Tax=Littorina saxatilis TaxID=31220 RepID=A0AAN9BF00_9CAEN
MAANISSMDITQDHGSNVEIAVLALTAFSTVATLVFLVTRLCCKYVIPEAWRLSLILQDIAYLLLGTGLIFFLAYVGVGTQALCSASGFFFLAGLLDCSSMLILTIVSLLFMQNPGKLGQLSTFKKSWIVVFVVPEKIVVFLLAMMPVTPIDYFDTESPYPLACFPVRQEGGKGAAFGAILFFILWILEILGLILSAVCAFRLWKSNKSRIHASSPNLWQTEKIGQGRGLQKMLMLEQLLLLVLTFSVTIVVYTNSADHLTPQWVVMVAAAVVTVLHASLCGVQLVFWSSACCCQGQQKTKEPYQKLKKLELIKVEGPGKIRLKASWSAGKGVTRRGLVKVYGLNQLKGWAQEIVVLGMLRKVHNASLLQCLWTANTNPYFETMTMLSGQIVTSESRLICLELTNSGNLQDFLSNLDVPLPEPCTRTILHDLAEGLAQLHSMNILHRNLTSTAVYLKGSIQRLVLRAAVGDFEEAQIYGTLQNGTITTSVSKKEFFLPDIRAFALVALEILGYVCKRRQQEKQPHRLITSPRTKVSGDLGDGNDRLGVGRGGDGKRTKKNAPALSNTQFCVPGVAEDFIAEKDPRAGGRIFVVGTTAEAEEAGLDKLKPKRGGGPSRGGTQDRIIRPPTLFENEYMDISDDGDEDSGRTSAAGYYPDQRDNQHPGDEEDPMLPPITHVREAYSYEFPSQSVFKAQDAQENDYEEIDDIEEEIHRELRYNALHRRREVSQTGGYIVTRTTSGRELFIPHNSSFADSGYVGTSSNNSSRYPNSVGEGVGGLDDPPDVSRPKAAHRTASAQTISSFGDDVLEVLPGMTDEDELKQGERSLRQMLRARDDAKVEQILEEYQQRVRNGDFSKLQKEWPKLKFSSTMGSKAGMVVGEGSRSQPTTPRVQEVPQHQEASTPRPKTAAVTSSDTTGVKHVDKARPLSASTSAAGAWKLRNSFKRNKARNELSRALSRGNSFAQGRNPHRELRGAGGTLIEEKYAAHNAAFKQDEDDVPTSGRQADDNDEHYEQPVLMSSGGLENLHQNRVPSSGPLGKDNEGVQHHVQEQQQQQQQQKQRIQHVQHPQAQQQQQQYIQHQSGQQQHANSSHHPHHTPNGVNNVGKFSSFSSSDSMMSYGEPPVNKRDTSLTSGELTSLSSQADTARGTSRDKPAQPLVKRASQGDVTENKVVVIPGMKIVDSGFDEDSASVVSDASYQGEANVSGEACTCSCRSGTVCDTCSCECSQCQYSHSGHSPRHSGWSESQSSCGTWSNSNSFSSYDVKMHRRKLPSKPKNPDEHVLGPDEQYPEHPPSVKPQSKPQVGSPDSLSPPDRQSHRHHNHHHHHHPHHKSHSHGGGSTSSRSSNSAALRRYRELTKKGVPLRVSKVDESDSPREHARLRSKQRPSLPRQDGATAEVIEEEEDGLDNALYQDLESQGFFESTDSASSKSSPVRTKKRAMCKRIEVVQRGGAGLAHAYFSDLPPIPSLEDIIQEIPDETGGSCSGDETKAFLNRPESELSLKALKPPAPPPPVGVLPYGKDVMPIADLHREPRVVHDAELVIDRMFSRAQPTNSRGSESFIDPSMGLDEATIRELAMLPPVMEANDRDLGDGAEDVHTPLLIGTDSKHVRYVHRLNDKVDLLTARELLPADQRSFDTLRRRLQHTGGFGTIGLQLLDIVGSCWVRESPPTTSDIVSQLTDHVTETEL